MSSNANDGGAVAAAMPTKGGNKELYLLGISFCTLWSSAFIAAKFGLTAAPPLAQLTVRFLFAGALLWAGMLILGKKWPADRRDLVTGIALGVLNNSAYLGLFYIAMQSITAGLAALIAALTPLATVFLAQPLLGEKITKRALMGVALGLAGAAIVLRERVGSGADDMVGVVLGGIAMLCLTSGTILYRKRGSHSDPFVMVTVQTITSGLVLIPFSLAMEDWGSIQLNTTFFLSVAYLSIMLSVVALLIWFRMIRIAGASRASAFHFLNPGLGMLFAFLILGEPLSLIDLAGLVPIVFGIILVTWVPAGRKAMKSPV
ncbi:EamA/RhaT family transporter [Hwanghaeella grinnelliae]|uniref:EamA/RhaT family transporter n=1 Tax=Hwanghaeella grinnelliae TaxID=2500179 RepID=A0A3S2W969_9PROT|nr:DMT family transporter [Hwanghaeella grinnelliae]RVU36327.1 EamA/RhaT family transporter [Hwanghaeella grinnelliae]